MYEQLQLNESNERYEATVYMQHTNTLQNAQTKLHWNLCKLYQQEGILYAAQGTKWSQINLYLVLPPSIFSNV